MGILDALLELQEQDIVIEQLRHRRATLPERAALEKVAAEMAAHDATTAEVQSSRERVAREQKRIEDEVASIEAKAAEVDQKLYSGTVTSPRELQGFQDDLRSLKRRQRQLEDQVIELMEEAEPLDASLAERTGERARLEEQRSTIQAALLEGEQQVDGELTAVEARRTEMATGLPSEAVSRYERLRDDLQGIAIARLVGSSCGGCHLTLSAVELDRIRHEPPDALIQCEECGRLLVR
jgi:predicted  nucleic acid-binding Zn-ribbon protein